jgi:hypothetical protein
MVIALIGILLLGVAVARPETVWTPDGDDLGRSLARAGQGFTVPHGCRPVSRPTWTCAVEDDPGSGTSGEYRLVARPDNCWSAWRRDRKADRPQTLKGCVTFSDFIGL